MNPLADVLLVIDLQNGVCHTGEDTIYQFEKLIPLVNNRITCYQAKNRPIIFVQHTEEGLEIGSSAWELVPELFQSAKHHFIGKTHANAFYRTSSQELLIELGVNSIELCGAQTQYCMDATIKVAHSLGYQLFMLKSATTTYDDALLSAPDMIRFYEQIWDTRFLTLVET